MEAEERAADPVYELQRELGLKKVPRSLVCFDISHAQGTDTVASCVWFENARAKRAEYRKFKVETVQGIDDFASMREVVGRYFRRRLDEERPLPDLVVIDGGKGQLNAAHEALEALGLGEHPLVSLAKREEEVFVFGRSESLRIPRRSPALRLLQQARDEAHRFAVTFQRKRRAVRTVTSELMTVPGIGPGEAAAAPAALRQRAGHPAGHAGGDRRAPGWTAAGAQKVLDALAASDPTRADGPEAPPRGAGCRRSSCRRSADRRRAPAILGT
jgi:excinuclease ABC subunit C